MPPPPAGIFTAATRVNRSRGEYDYVAASAAFALGLRADPPPTGIGPGRSCWTTTCLDLHGVLVSLWYRFPYQCVQGLSPTPLAAAAATRRQRRRGE